MQKKFVSFFLFCFLGLASAAGAATLSLNTGTAEELLAIPYTQMTPEQAQAIVEYRTQNGPFKKAADLEKVPGLSPNVLMRIPMRATKNDLLWDPAMEEEDPDQPTGMKGY